MKIQIIVDKNLVILGDDSVNIDCSKFKDQFFAAPAMLPRQLERKKKKIPRKRRRKWRRRRRRRERRENRFYKR